MLYISDCVGCFHFMRQGLIVSLHHISIIALSVWHVKRSSAVKYLIIDRAPSKKTKQFNRKKYHQHNINSSIFVLIFQYALDRFVLLFLVDCRKMVPVA